jgi:hypothetical protein
MSSIWRELLVESLVRPRVAARRVLDLELRADMLIEAALAITCLGVILGALSIRLNPGAVDQLSAFVIGNPLLGAAVQLVVLAVIVLFVFRVGRFFGGTGDAVGALAIVVWLDAVMVAIQMVQIVALLLFPPFATLLALAAVLWVVWAMACFVSELHGFQNTVVVVGGVILSMTVMFFGLALLLTLLGVPSEGFE